MTVDVIFRGDEPAVIQMVLHYRNGYDAEIPALMLEQPVVIWLRERVAEGTATFTIKPPQYLSIDDWTTRHSWSRLAHYQVTFSFEHASDAALFKLTWK